MPQLVTPRLAAQIQRYTENMAYTDTATYISPTSVSTSISCSFTDRSNVDQTQYGFFQIMDAAIRFSSLTPEHGGRITITKRFGESITNKTFEIVEIFDRGSFGFVCNLKEVIA